MSESGETLAFELTGSRLLLGLCLGWYALVSVLVITRWGMGYGLALWWPCVMLIAALYSYRQLLTPGRGGIPRSVVIRTDGEWCFDGSSGYLVGAWVSPWLCRVVLSRRDGGRCVLWLPRDALGDDGHWRLRRLLVQSEVG